MEPSQKRLQVPLSQKLCVQAFGPLRRDRGRDCSSVCCSANLGICSRTAVVGDKSPSSIRHGKAMHGGAPELNRFDLKMFDQEGLRLSGADACSRWFRTSYWPSQNNPRDQCDENDGRDYSEYEWPGIAPLPGEHHMRVIVSRILFICRNFRISCHCSPHESLIGKSTSQAMRTRAPRQ